MTGSKTLAQRLIEHRYGKDLDQILRDALEARRGQKRFVQLAASDLGLSDATLYQWAKQTGVSVDGYKYAEPVQPILES